MGGACIPRHQLAADFNSSFSIFQMTYEIPHTNRMGEEGDFCDAKHYVSVKRHENGSFVEGEDKVAWLDLRCLRISPNPSSMES